MLQHFNLRNVLFASMLVAGLSSCSDDEERPIDPSPGPELRTKIDYAKITPTTPYKSLFVDTKGDTTVDLTSGNARYKMFQALNYYLGSAVRDSTQVTAAVMKNMYANTGNPFTDISTSTINIKGADLNASGVQLRDVTASSKTAAEADAARAHLETSFAALEAASKSVKVPAAKGVAGKLGTYLVDSKGIEHGQIIQKGLIGALQMDYIGNVLLDKGLDVDNISLVSGKKYTALEHNWDEAYGLLTLNPVYLAGATDAARTSNESFIGSYIWEYNKASYAKIHPAFVKGRAAIVNMDNAEVKTQATFIRTEMEKAIASAALGYLGKWKSGTTDAARAHAIGEGLGFIYSLRYCKINGADAAFSDALLLGLMGSPNGFWDLTNDKINAASDAITAKFKL
ncbi:DUF4856 domain-containing protein [Dyadobacter chenhuakuii]|uniref:DUF4856 domain-containing protein n=1 Tax=Dyadobacter chenhuakuii TaxID=2909339 RepID=A0ABY4XMT1_9BACT|nr:DUF4856 domain-containing protein [Dyadobacter chenhuakuii]MCF2494348.1 DUF4856 domain-containing protein [Dyadobacter chenhuakuii]USJ31470.1 DUF4856 domain-containing protein [Dyadobacter chenhuakuii]